MPERTLGTPIPLGLVDAKGVHELEAPSMTDPIKEQVVALKQQIADLRDQVAKIGKRTVATVEAHPFITATAISVGLWAVIALIARRPIRRFLR